MRPFIRSTFGLVAVLATVATALTVAPPVAEAYATFTDTTSADFDAGTTHDGAVVAEGDGAVRHAPGSANFNGSSLPDDWQFTSTTGTSGTHSVTGGKVSVDGGHVTSPHHLAPGRTVTFKATFGTVAGQTVGFGQDSAAPAIGFGTRMNANGTGVVPAVIIGPNLVINLVPNGGFLGVERTYRVEWYGNVKSIYVLDHPTRNPAMPLYSTTTENATSRSLGTLISDTTADAAPLQVSDVRFETLGSLDHSFDSPSPAWFATNPSSQPSFANGEALIDGLIYQGGRSVEGGTLEFVATLRPTSQQLGWYGHGIPNTGASPHAMINVSAGTTPSVRFSTATGSGTSWSTVVPNGTSLFHAPHTYRFEWRGGSVRFSVPDVPSIAPITRNVVISRTMRPHVQESPANGSGLTVHDMTYTPWTSPDTSFDTVPQDWTSTALAGGGATSYVNGGAEVDESLLASDASFSAGRALTFRATFTSAGGQTGGWGQTLATGQPLAVLRSSGGQLLADAGGTTQVMPSSLLDAEHEYRILWRNGTYTFSCVDVACPSVSMPGTMTESLRPVFKDQNTSGTSFRVGDVDVDPLTAAYESRIFDAGVQQRWSRTQWQSTTPSGTAVRIKVRAGETPAPDTTWTSWVTVENSGDSADVIGRYAQYRVDFEAEREPNHATVQSVSLTAAAVTLGDFTDTTVDDFSEGTLGNTTTTSNGDGEVTLQRPVYEQFNGPTLPAGWTGNATINNGILSIDQSNVTNNIAYPYGTTIEFSARFQGGYDMRAGWNGAFYWGCPDYPIVCANTYPNYYGWIEASSAGQFHRYRITFTETETIFHVDGLWRATVGPTGWGNLVPSFWDVDGGHVLEVDWVAITPFDYPSTQTFESRVFDAGQAVCWDDLSWNVDLPIDAKLAMKVRTGNSPTPDATWTPFRSVRESGDAIKQTSRYVQYAADLTAFRGDAFLSLQDVTIGRGATGPCASVTDTTVTDFDSGMGTNVFSTRWSEGAATDGDLVVPVGSTNFPGDDLPGGWRNRTPDNPYWSDDGYQVSNNTLSLVGAEVVNENTLSSGHSVEFTATFRYPGFQQAGFSGATFEVSNGSLMATTGAGGDYSLWGGGYYGAPHRYRIEWYGTNAAFYVDGNYLTSHYAPPGDRNIRFYAGADGPALDIQDVVIDNYSASGSYESRIIDQSEVVDWSTISWDDDVPVGTALSVEVRTGDTPTPDGTWSAFQAVANGGSINASSRYLQYRVVMSTSTNDTVPSLHSITVSRQT